MKKNTKYINKFASILFIAGGLALTPSAAIAGGEIVEVEVNQGFTIRTEVFETPHSIGFIRTCEGYGSYVEHELEAWLDPRTKQLLLMGKERWQPYEVPVVTNIQVMNYEQGMDAQMILNMIEQMKNDVMAGSSNGFGALLKSFAKAAAKMFYSWADDDGDGVSNGNEDDDGDGLINWYDPDWDPFGDDENITAESEGGIWMLYNDVIATREFGFVTQNWLQFNGLGRTILIDRVIPAY